MNFNEGLLIYSEPSDETEPMSQPEHPEPTYKCAGPCACTPVVRCEGPCVCTPVNELASEYVRNTLTLDAKIRFIGNDDWRDSDDRALDVYSEDAERLHSVFGELTEKRLADVIAIVCTYTAHLTDVLHGATRDDESLTVPELNTVGSSNTPNLFRVLAALVSNPEPDRRTLNRLLDPVTRQLEALGRFVDLLPHNPIHRALTELDRAHDAALGRYEA